MKNKLQEFTNDNINKKIKKKNRRSLLKSIVIYFLLAILSIYFLIVIWGTFSERNSGFQINSFIVISGSMMPTLDINDLIFSVKVEQSELKQGDIISFYKENQVITHRIEEIVEQNGQTLYKTKGDNNNSSDEELVKYEEIMGRYLFKIPKVGYVVRNLQTRIGIIVVILLLFIREIQIRNKENKEMIRHQKRIEMEESKDKSDT